MSIAAELRESIENPQNDLIRIRKEIIKLRRETLSNGELIDAYINAGNLLEQKKRNPLPQALFDDTDCVPVVNLADNNHRFNDHKLSLMHPETINKAKESGFTDIVLEGHYIPNKTDMYDEYVHTLREFAAGQDHVEITLGDQTISFNEMEYRAHIFGTILVLNTTYLNLEEASRVSRATMDAIEYAASQGIRFHAIGTLHKNTENFILPWQEKYEAAKSLAPEERTTEQTKLLKDFEKDPYTVYEEAIKSPDSIRNWNKTKENFLVKAINTYIDERTGGAAINIITSDEIAKIIQNRKIDGYTNPRVLHMHGLGHFTGPDDIDNLLRKKGIESRTIGFSGASQENADLSASFERAMERQNNSEQPDDFPHWWFFAPEGKFIPVDIKKIRAVVLEEITGLPQQPLEGNNIREVKPPPLCGKPN
ncbi:MAG: hypothetical protein OEY94_10720 [Alphaproteobacteria bacterium]|nr:hypothetical protein [Alphaproteobacteria bacterium]